MLKYRHNKTGKLYELVCIATDTTNARAGAKIVVYSDDKQTFARDQIEFEEKFTKEPNRCCCCGTTENLRKDGWYGYRCNGADCVPY